MPLPSGVSVLRGGWDGATDGSTANDETGVLNGIWNGGQQQFVGARKITSTVVRDSPRACRFEVDGRSSDGYGNRAEVQAPGYETEGDDLWYRWSILFGEPNVTDRTKFPTYSGWQTVGQWHSRFDGSPPLSFYTSGGTHYQLVLNLATGSNQPRNIVEYGHLVWQTPIVTGSWLDFRLHVKWSARDDVGFQELWYNGTQQTLRGGVKRYMKRNLDPGTFNFRKVGFYRQASTSVGTHIIYWDNVDVATYDLGDPGGSTPPPPPPPPPPPLVIPEPPHPADSTFGVRTATAYQPANGDSKRGTVAILSERRKLEGYATLMRGSNTGTGSQAHTHAMYLPGTDYKTEPLLAGTTSAEVSVAYNAAPAWFFAPVTSGPALEPRNYRPTHHSGPNNVSDYGTAPGSLAYARDLYGDGMASTFAGQAEGFFDGIDTGVALASYVVTSLLISAPGAAALSVVSEGIVTIAAKLVNEASSIIPQNDLEWITVEAPRTYEIRRARQRSTKRAVKWIGPGLYDYVIDPDDVPPGNPT